MGMVKANPVLVVQTLPLAVINLLAAFGVFTPTPEQLGSVNAVLAVVLGIVTRTQVTPTNGTPPPAKTVGTSQVP